MSKMAVIYYKSPNYCDNVLDWRFSQSLARTLCFDYGAKLVEFNAEDYFSWLGEEEDTKARRAEWAALQ